MHFWHCSRIFIHWINVKFDTKHWDAKLHAFFAIYCCCNTQESQRESSIFRAFQIKFSSFWQIVTSFTGLYICTFANFVQMYIHIEYLHKIHQSNVYTPAHIGIFKTIEWHKPLKSTNIAPHEKDRKCLWNCCTNVNMFSVEGNARVPFTIFDAHSVNVLMHKESLLVECVFVLYIL